MGEAGLTGVGRTRDLGDRACRAVSRRHGRQRPPGDGHEHVVVVVHVRTGAVACLLERPGCDPHPLVVDRCLALRASAMAFSSSWGDGGPSLALVVGFGSKLPPLVAVWCAHRRPHITICYSTSSQPAKPIIDALGTQLPGCDIAIRALSLNSPMNWRWLSVGTRKVPSELG